MKKLLSVIIVFLCFWGKSQSLDSLFRIYSDKTKTDSQRLVSLIRYLDQQYNFDSQYRALLDTAKLMLNKTRIDSVEVGVFYNVLGKYLYFTDNFDSARVILKKAIGIFTRKNDLLHIAISYGNYGNTYCIEGNLVECLKNLLKAQDYFYKVRDTNLIIVGENNIGNIYFSIGDTLNALRQFQKVYSLAGKVNNLRSLALAAKNLSAVFFVLEQYDSVIYYSHKAITTAKKINHLRILSEAYQNLGVVYLKLQNYDSAFYYINRALKIYEELNDLQNKIAIYNNLATYYRLQRDYENAYKYANEALEMAKYFGAKSLLQDIYFELFKLDSLNGNFQKALENYILFTVYKDSVKRAEVQKEIVNMEAKYELKFINRENKLLKERDLKQKIIIKRQKTILILSNLLGIFLIFFLLYFIYTVRTIKRINKELLKRNQEIEKKNKLLEKQQQEIDASLRYSAYLQFSLLPNLELLKGFFREWFVFYKPQHIVSGDFYWLHRISDEKIIVVVGDCTGHGVPGAMISVLTITLLNETLKEARNLSAAQTLNLGREKIKKTLSASESLAKNTGLDVALIIFDKKLLQINFAGAFRPVYIIREGKLFELKGNRQPIAAYLEEKPFTDFFFDVRKNDMIYMFTDGFPDLFSEDYKKFTIRRFKNLLVKIHSLPAEKQKQELEKTYLLWKQNAQQVDDITILGLRI